MHFPVPLPWLRRKVSAARWVTWVGRLYLCAGMACLTATWLVISSPPSQAPNQNCTRLANTVFSSFSEPLRGGRVHHSEPIATCVSHVYDQQNIRWFTISSSSADYAPNHDFLEERRNLSRLAYTVQPVEGIGTRGVLAKPKPGSSLNPILIFANSEGRYRIEINGRKVANVQIDRLIDVLRGTLRTRRDRSL